MSSSTRKKKTILFLAANPKNAAQLRLDQEVKEIDAGLERSQKRDKFQLEKMSAITPRDLQRAMLDYKPQIVHFSGHGVGEDGIVLEDINGQATLVRGEALAKLFRFFAEKCNIECVVLNACYSEVQANAIAQHVPFVIGMNQAIGDRAAREFAVGFYDALGAGELIESAYENGCISISLHGIPEELTPVIQRQSETLVEPEPEEPKQPAIVGESRKLEVVQKAMAPSAPVAHPALDLDVPEGQVPLESPLYVERPPIEARCYETIVDPGALIRIKAPRQMGKSSLMLRILHYAIKQDYQTASLNFQLVDRESLSSLDSFLQWFCSSITWELNLDDRLTEFWKGAFSSKNKCTNYFQRYLLPELKRPVVLCLDEVDQVFEYPTIATDFFGMLRAWHEDAKIKPIWKNLRLVIVHSKEVYIPLNINQSPFNVGVPIELPQLTHAQVVDLVKRHELNWSDATVTQLIDMVGGHPYLVRAALYEVARGELSLADLRQQAPTEGGLYGEHLRRHLLNLENDETLLAAMKEVISGNQAIAIKTSEAFKLTSMGLVRFEGSKVVPSCNLYRRYFQERLTSFSKDDRGAENTRGNVAESRFVMPPPILDGQVTVASDQQQKLYLSYAWGGESEAFVNRLDASFQTKGIIIIRDKRNLGYKGLIKEFMERIGRGKGIITVISDKYLKSPNCMFELVQIAQNGHFYDRIFPIVMADAQIFRPTERIKYVRYWEDQIKELDEAMRGVSAANLQGFREEIDQYTQIRNTIAELTSILKNMNTLTSDMHSESDFDELFGAIATKLEE
jgi:hypothetical protein